MELISSLVRVSGFWGNSNCIALYSSNRKNRRPKICQVSLVKKGAAMQEQQYSRTQVYLSSNRNAEPKYMFACLGDIIERQGYSILSEFKMLDVGTATGDFIQYILNRFSKVECMGVNFDEQLIKRAENRNINASFRVGDANNLSCINDSSFDVVTLIGTHSIFDDFRPSFSECI
ncbi:class I SAM-dependent methyltransferase [Geitlerinema sp. CS-897]|nr:class I SAM-dependent methyltransferase [Geitlerinema sp. CS-897]